MKGEWGTFTREKPCGKCGSHEFYICTRGCVFCNRARVAEHAVKKRKQQQPEKPKAPKARKSTELRSDRSTVSDMLSRKW